ncbi:MAG: hypothetical protein HZY75_12960 [Nocardioidaceae bacterium]|nr:MAG: hypothetical protein HZY75_12960 [Nocardioidaceae bacterium]
MTIEQKQPRHRRSLRTAAVIPALALLIGTLASTVPASAATPDSPSWPDPQNESLMWYILVLVGIPILLFVAIWFLVSVPYVLKKSDAPGEGLESRDPQAD